MNVLDFFGFESNDSLTRVQKIHRENERSNFLMITRLVLNAFVQEKMTVKHRMIENDTQRLKDLFIMLEKILWHGFKSSVKRSVFLLRNPDADLWRFMMKVSTNHLDMMESFNSIDQLESITIPLCRIRAFLRLAVMQKKLSDYFHYTMASTLLGDYYESWAFLRNEEFVYLSGALISMSAVDCSLLLDQNQLQEQPMSINLTSYFRSSTKAMENEVKDYDDSNSSLNPLNVMLDQKNFLEERNRYLETKNAELKKKISDLQGNILAEEPVICPQNCVRLEEASEEVLSKITRERNELTLLLSEKDDSIKILEQQIADTRMINVDLYEKIRLLEDNCKQMEKELAKTKEHSAQEKEQLRRTIDALKCHSDEKQSELECNYDTRENMRNELAYKTEQYLNVLDALRAKQDSLIKANNQLERLSKTNEVMVEQLKQMPVIEQEFSELLNQYADASIKLEEYEMALEELGGNLSQSKLKIVELKEELLPLSEAQWEKDVDVLICKTCNVQFSVSKRKHHCRNCGSIFCNSCSNARVKLPSNKRAVRVCLLCYNLLKSRQNTSLEESFR